MRHAGELCMRTLFCKIPFTICCNFRGFLTHAVAQRAEHGLKCVEAEPDTAVILGFEGFEDPAHVDAFFVLSQACSKFKIADGLEVPDYYRVAEIIDPH